MAKTKKRQSIHGVKRTRLDGAGRKPLLEEMKDDLLVWVLERRILGLHVSTTIIMRKALSLKNSDEKYSPESGMAGKSYAETRS